MKYLLRKKSATAIATPSTCRLSEIIPDCLDRQALLPSEGLKAPLFHNLPEAV